MKYEVNTIVATLVKKDKAPKGSVGAILGFKEDEQNGQVLYLVELFTVTSVEHLQLFYTKDEIYAIQQ